MLRVLPHKRMWSSYEVASLLQVVATMQGVVYMFYVMAQFISLYAMCYKCGWTCVNKRKHKQPDSLCCLFCEDSYNLQ